MVQVPSGPTETPVTCREGCCSCAPFFPLPFLHFKCHLEVQHALGVLAVGRAPHAWVDLLIPGHCPRPLQAAGCFPLWFGNRDALGRALQAVEERLVEAKACWCYCQILVFKVSRILRVPISDWVGRSPSKAGWNETCADSTTGS